MTHPIALVETVTTNKALANKFRRMAASKDILFNAQMRFARQIVANNLDGFALVEQDSWENAMLDLALTGLSLQPSLGHCYLIPYKKQVSVTISYRGMEHLVLSAGTVKSIQTDLVYKEDPHYKVYMAGSPPMKHVEHEKFRGKRSVVTHGYCTATYANGGWHVEDVDAAFFDACLKAATSRNAKGGAVWKGPFADEQRKKSIVRRAYKHWPQDPSGHLARVMEMMDKLEPMSFKGEPDKEPPQQELVISQNESNELHAMLVNAGLEPAKADKWLQALADKWGLGVIANMPARRFDEAKAELKTALESRAAKRGAAGASAAG